MNINWGYCHTGLKKEDIVPIVVLNAVDFVEVIHSELYSIKILVTDFTLETVWMETLSSGSQNLH